MPDRLAALLGREVAVHARGGARLAEQANPATRLGAATAAALAAGGAGTCGAGVRRGRGQRGRGVLGGRRRGRRGRRSPRRRRRAPERGRQRAGSQRAGGDAWSLTACSRLRCTASAPRCALFHSPKARGPAPPPTEGPTPCTEALNPHGALVVHPGPLTQPRACRPAKPISPVAPPYRPAPRGAPRLHNTPESRSRLRRRARARRGGQRRSTQ